MESMNKSYSRKIATIVTRLALCMLMIIECYSLTGNLNNFGRTPLGEAIYHGDLKIFKFLIKKLDMDAHKGDNYNNMMHKRNAC